MEIKRADGVVFAVLAAYYICRCTHGDFEPCNTIILSKEWNRKFQDDPLHSQQAWYCNICATRYVTKYGMLLELFSNEEAMYMKAPVKPFDILDLLALKFEEDYKPQTPEELYGKIPTANIAMNAVVRKAGQGDDWKGRNRLEGVYKVDNAFFEALPMWEWFDIFTFSSKNPLTGQKWTKSGKEQRIVGYNKMFKGHVDKALKLS